MLPSNAEAIVKEMSSLSLNLIDDTLLNGRCESEERETKSKEAIRAKKKEDKSIEHILKALNSLDTPEEKLAALCKKYADEHEEHRLLQNKNKVTQKQLTGVVREKDHLQTEHSKTVLAKSKLESLCRELQKHNKLVKEESLARAREEEEKRKEVSSKFQTTINEIQGQMNEHYNKNTKLREENIELANKLKNIYEQYELREQKVEKMFKHKDLEQQLLDAKLSQANLYIQEECQKNMLEKEKLLLEAVHDKNKIQQLEDQERTLKSQVTLYSEKYEEFQSTLAKSSEVFQTFKAEMEKMTKRIKNLEKETSMWRTRWENSNKTLIGMAEEKARNDKEIDMLAKKNKKLESLCRALQQERNKLSGSESKSSSRDASVEPSNNKENQCSSESIPNSYNDIKITATDDNSEVSNEQNDSKCCNTNKLPYRNVIEEVSSIASSEGNTAPNELSAVGMIDSSEKNNISHDNTFENETDMCNENTNSHNSVINDQISLEPYSAVVENSNVTPMNDLSHLEEMPHSENVDNGCDEKEILPNESEIENIILDANKKIAELKLVVKDDSELNCCSEEHASPSDIPLT